MGEKELIEKGKKFIYEEDWQKWEEEMNEMIQNGSFDLQDLETIVQIMEKAEEEKDYAEAGKLIKSASGRDKYFNYSLTVLKYSKDGPDLFESVFGKDTNIDSSFKKLLADRTSQILSHDKKEFNEKAVEGINRMVEENLDLTYPDRADEFRDYLVRKSTLAATFNANKGREVVVSLRMMRDIQEGKDINEIAEELEKLSQESKSLGKTVREILTRFSPKGPEIYEQTAAKMDKAALKKVEAQRKKNEKSEALIEKDGIIPKTAEEIESAKAEIDEFDKMRDEYLKRLENDEIELNRRDDQLDRKKKEEVKEYITRMTKEDPKVNISSIRTTVDQVKDIIHEEEKIQNQDQEVK